MRLSRSRACCARPSSPLPVYIELPRDLVGAEVAPVPMLPRRRADPEALAECATEILDRLARAERPALMVDVEVRRYGVEAKVAALAKRLGVPVVTSFMGRGLLSARSGAGRGTYLARPVEGDHRSRGAGGLATTARRHPERYQFRGLTPEIDLRAMTLAINREVRIGHHVFSDIPLDELVDALLAGRLETRNAGAPPSSVEQPTRREMPADDTLLAPSDIAAAINDLFERHGPMPIAADMGDCLFTAMEIANTNLVAPGYYAGMGYGVPAGLGACVASGGRPLILVGDGAFQMTGFELGNCRRYGWDPIVIVFNNASWQMLRAFQPELKFNDLDDWNFAALAPTLGGEGYASTPARSRPRRSNAQPRRAAASSSSRRCSPAAARPGCSRASRPASRRGARGIALPRIRPGRGPAKRQSQPNLTCSSTSV